MPNQPSDNSWDAGDVMPPVNPREAASGHDARISRPSTPPPPVDIVPIAGTTPGDAVTQAIDAIVQTKSSTPSAPPPSRPVIKSIVDENQALADASIKARRGQLAEARADIEAVIEQRPRSAAAYEALADIETSLGLIPAADEALRKAIEIEPGRPTAEAKLAHLALRGLEQSRRHQRHEGVAASPRDTSAPVPGDNRRMYAILGSVVMPGLGQFVNGQYAVGAGLVAATVVSFFMMMSGVDVHGLQNTLHQDMAAVTDSTQAVPPSPQIGWTFWVGALIATLAWLYSLIESTGLTGRRNPKQS